MKPPSGKGMRLAYLLLNLASFCLATPLWKDRDALMQEEKSHQTGGNLVLSRQEQQLSTKLVNLKKEEVAAAITRGAFPPSMHFFRARGLIDQSSVFSILKRMPKGRLGLGFARPVCPPLTFCCLWQRQDKVLYVAAQLMRTVNWACWAPGKALPLSLGTGQEEKGRGGWTG